MKIGRIFTKINGEPTPGRLLTDDEKEEKWARLTERNETVQPRYRRDLDALKQMYDGHQKQAEELRNQATVQRNQAEEEQKQAEEQRNQAEEQQKQAEELRKQAVVSKKMGKKHVDLESRLAKVERTIKTQVKEKAAKAAKIKDDASKTKAEKAEKVMVKRLETQRDKAVTKLGTITAEIGRLEALRLEAKKKAEEAVRLQAAPTSEELEESA